MRPRRPGEERSLRPWIWLCAVLIAVLAVLLLLPAPPKADLACALGVHPCPR